MRVGINEYILSAKIGFEKSIEFLKATGFDCVDFCYYMRNQEFENDDYFDVAQNYKAILDKYNIEVSQMHANWFKNEDDTSIKNYKIKMNERAFEVAKILGCKYVVVHATKFKGYYSDKTIYSQANDYNIRLFKHYLKYAKEQDVYLTIENMFGYETDTVKPAETIFSSAKQMNEYIDILSDNCAVCLDTGHAYIANQNISEMISQLNKRLKVLHIHDAIMTEDAHLVPTLGSINWQNFLQSLSSIKYDGVLSLEIFPQSSIGIKEYIKYGYAVVTDFAKIMEEN